MAKTNQVVIASGKVSTSRATRKRAGKRKTIHRVKSTIDVSSFPYTSKRASGEVARSTLLSIRELPATGTRRRKKPADQILVDTQNEIVGSRSRDQSPFANQEVTVVAPSFPNELLQDYRIYRQLQSALVRIGNQLQAIKKYDPSHGALIPLLGMQSAGKADYRAVEKRMISAVRTLPIWESWAKDIRGLAENSLAQILGETGDLSNYANPAKLWKRMGLGLVNGHRQQFWAANRKGFTRSENIEMAVEMGYSARRRALMAVVGVNFIRAKNLDYGKLYRERKEYEWDKLPAKDENGKTNKSRKSHAHKRALRYMEKRFLLNLWKAWRGQHQADTHGIVAAMSSTKKRRTKRALLEM